MSTTPRQSPWTILPKRKWEPTGTRIVKDGDNKDRVIRTWSSKEKTSLDDEADDLAREAVGL